MKILIGSDPEMFVKDSSGSFVSGHDLIPGNKRNPFLVRNGAIQVDGVACEFNIVPAASEEEFLSSIRSVQHQMQSVIWEKNPDLHLVAEPVAMFEEKYFRSLPMEALLLGCEPDFNAWTETKNCPPSTSKPMRTGAGHIHIGWTEGESRHNKNHLALCMEVVKQLDATLYPLSMEWDSDETRRELYGRQGSFRPKHYGVEYRPLSNAFLRDDDVIRLVYQTTVSAVEDLFAGNVLYDESTWVDRPAVEMVA